MLTDKNIKKNKNKATFKMVNKHVLILKTAVLPYYLEIGLNCIYQSFLAKSEIDSFNNPAKIWPYLLLVANGIEHTQKALIEFHNKPRIKIFRPEPSLAANGIENNREALNNFYNEYKLKPYSVKAFRNGNYSHELKKGHHKLFPGDNEYEALLSLLTKFQEPIYRFENSNSDSATNPDKSGNLEYLLKEYVLKSHIKYLNSNDNVINKRIFNINDLTDEIIFKTLDYELNDILQKYYPLMISNPRSGTPDFASFRFLAMDKNKNVDQEQLKRLKSFSLLDENVQNPKVINMIKRMQSPIKTSGEPNFSIPHQGGYNQSYPKRQDYKLEYDLEIGKEAVAAGLKALSKVEDMLEPAGLWTSFLLLANGIEKLSKATVLMSFDDEEIKSIILNTFKANSKHDLIEVYEVINRIIDEPNNEQSRHFMELMTYFINGMIRYENNYLFKNRKGFKASMMTKQDDLMEYNIYASLLNEKLDPSHLKYLKNTLSSLPNKSFYKQNNALNPFDEFEINVASYVQNVLFKDIVLANNQEFFNNQTLLEYPEYIAFVMQGVIVGLLKHYEKSGVIINFEPPLLISKVSEKEKVRKR